MNDMDLSIAEKVSPIEISVIVPVWNDPVRIRLCIEALLDQSLPRERYEIIVVDNGSADDTATVASSYDGVIVLSEPKKGSYAARNKGLEHARGEILAFTDSDCIPERTWLEEGLAVFRSDPTVDMVGGHVALFPTEDCKSRMCVNFEQLFGVNQRQYVRGGAAITANWMASRALVEKTGGFDDTLLSGGDIDMTRRAVAAGGKLVFSEAALVHHPIRGSLGSLIRKGRRTASGSWDKARKNGELLFLPFKHTRFAAGRALNTFRFHKGTVYEKLEVVFVVFILYLVFCFEYVRRTFGGAPHRS